MPPTEPGGEATFIHEPSMTGGSGVPLLMIYGTGEDNILGEDTRALVTYEQWVADKAMVVIQGLDHDGMVDLPVALFENTIPSTLPAEERAALVADTVMVWLNVMLDDGQVVKSEGGFCDQLDMALGEENVSICMDSTAEPSDDHDSSDDDDVNLGVAIGVPVGVVVFIGAVLILLVVRRKSAVVGTSKHDVDLEEADPARHVGNEQVGNVEMKMTEPK
jgi:hypothetical protein